MCVARLCVVARGLAAAHLVGRCVAQVSLVAKGMGAGTARGGRRLVGGRSCPCSVSRWSCPSDSMWRCRASGRRLVVGVGDSRVSRGTSRGRSRCPARIAARFRVGRPRPCPKLIPLVV
jgi:hypothetical protein